MLLDMLFLRLFVEIDKIIEGWVIGWVMCCFIFLELKFLFNFLVFCNKFISKFLGMDIILLVEDWEEEECFCCGCILGFIVWDVDVFFCELKLEFIGFLNFILEVFDVEVGFRCRCLLCVWKNWLDFLLWGKFWVFRCVVVVCGCLLENVFIDWDGVMLCIDCWLKENDWKIIYNCN